MLLEYTFRKNHTFASEATGIIIIEAGTKGELHKVVNYYQTIANDTVINILVKVKGHKHPFSIYYVKGSEDDQFKDYTFVYPLDEKVVVGGKEYTLYGYKTAEGKDVYPRYCKDCEEGMWSGHVIDDGDYYLCCGCMEKTYDEDVRERMYQNDEQYYTEWDESELEEENYIIVQSC